MTIQRTTQAANGQVRVDSVSELTLQREFWRYFELYNAEPYAALLDSARDAESLGRYSFLIGEPERVFEARRKPGGAPGEAADCAWITLRDENGAPLDRPLRSPLSCEPFEALREASAERRLPPWGEAPAPFFTGMVGYFAYEAGYLIERLPNLGRDDLEVPDVTMMVADVVWCHDHRSGRSHLCISIVARDEASALRAVERRRQRVLAQIAAFEARPAAGAERPAASAGQVDIQGHANEASYVETVERAKDHIRAGDIFEVCTTHRREAAYAGDPWLLYGELRRINPAPFACYLKFPWGQLVSSSPERFIRLDAERVAESRPIKGTRPRGATAEQDAELRADLFRSIKDRAENVMIVDLVRNDLGRVCEIDSVHVPELMVIEEYATVFQMVSTIRGKLRRDRDAFDLIRACFPGGSMTGAPKIEAMKIIDALEPYKRGIYSGAVGYLDDRGMLDLNIVIRSFLIKNRRCYFSVGGAVVADSNPVGEYRETLDKAAALERALRNAVSLGAES